MTLPIALGAPIIEFPVQRVFCPDCGVTRQVKTDSAEMVRRYTKRFEWYVFDLSKHMTMMDTARHLETRWLLRKNPENLDYHPTNSEVRKCSAFAIQHFDCSCLSLLVFCQI
jgi:hypothetical protein